MKKILLLFILCFSNVLIYAQTPEEFFNSGKKSLETRKWGEAIMAFSKAIEGKEDFAQAFVFRGTAEYYRGNIDGACINWFKAKDLGLQEVAQIIKAYVPKTFDMMRRAEDYAEEGKARFEGGDYEGAIESYTNALYANPKFAWAYNKRAYALTNMEKYKEAVEDYDKAIAIDGGNDARLFTFRGMAKCKSGDKSGGCNDILTGIAKGHEKAKSLLTNPLYNCNKN